MKYQMHAQTQTEKVRSKWEQVDNEEDQSEWLRRVNEEGVIRVNELLGRIEWADRKIEG